MPATPKQERAEAAAARSLQAADTKFVGGIAGDRLRSFIERIERLKDEQKALAADVKEVFAEAKGTGFDTKIMRKLIAIRAMDKDDFDEQETLLDVYMKAIGMRKFLAAASGSGDEE
jgi:uncharacterized protein (UPF0335 family)